MNNHPVLIYFTLKSWPNPRFALRFDETLLRSPIANAWGRGHEISEPQGRIERAMIIAWYSIAALPALLRTIGFFRPNIAGDPCFEG